MEKLSIEDCMCPICMCIFVEPVTMPCTHTLCMPCFKKNVEEASLTCPMCRTRISVWARRASKNRKLIDEKLWTDIQSLFPEKVKKRIEGDDEEEGVEDFMHPIINIAQPGEIRKEYEEQLKRLAEQREKEQQKELEASEALIRKLQEEEELANRMRKKEQIEIQKLDEEFAKELTNTEGESPVSIETLSRTRLSRSTSSCSSVSATSSRPASTLDTFLSKMREAEKLKEKDRGCMSPYPYSCISPQDKAKSNNSNNSPTLNDRGLSVISVSSSDSNNSNDQTIDYGYVDINTGPVKGKERQSKSNNNNKTKTETVGNPTTVETQSRSSSTTVLGAGNDTEKNVGQTRSSSAQSNDSISQELIHFRPIKLCPLTPPKRLASGKVVEPPLIRTTPKNLNKTSFGSPERTLSDIDASSPIMQRRLSELSEERKEMVNKLSKSTGTSSDNEGKSRNVRMSSFEEVKKENSENQGKDDKVLSTSSGVENRINVKNNGYLPESSNKAPAKKLIIPLEANLHEDDEFDLLTPLVEINNINHTRSPTCAGDKISLKDKNDNNINRGKSAVTNVIRKKANKLTLTRKKEPSNEILSPQRSIIDYLRGDYSCGDCGSTSKIIKETNKTLSYGRDEVDGSVSSAKTVNVDKCGDRVITVDKSVKINTRGRSPTRKSKRTYDPDFVWADLSPKKRARNKKRTCDSELDSYNSEGEDIMDTSSDISSFSKDDDVVNRKKETGVDTRSLDNYVRKTKRVLSETDITTAPRAAKRRKAESQTEDKVKKRKTLKSAKHKKKIIQHNAKVKKTNKVNEEKTVQSFLSSFNNKDDTTDDTDIADQEYLDRQFALKLEKQFQMEAKMSLNALRFKGTEDQYNFRSKPKYVSL